MSGQRTGSKPGGGARPRANSQKLNPKLLQRFETLGTETAAQDRQEPPTRVKKRSSLEKLDRQRKGSIKNLTALYESLSSPRKKNDVAARRGAATARIRAESSVAAPAQVPVPAVPDMPDVVAAAPDGSAATGADGKPLLSPRTLDDDGEVEPEFEQFMSVTVKKKMAEEEERNKRASVRDVDWRQGAIPATNELIKSAASAPPRRRTEPESRSAGSRGPVRRGVMPKPKMTRAQQKEAAAKAKAEQERVERERTDAAQLAEQQRRDAAKAQADAKAKAAKEAEAAAATAKKEAEAAAAAAKAKEKADVAAAKAKKEADAAAVKAKKESEAKAKKAAEADAAKAKKQAEAAATKAKQEATAAAKAKKDADAAAATARAKQAGSSTVAKPAPASLAMPDAAPRQRKVSQSLVEALFGTDDATAAAQRKASASASAVAPPTTPDRHFVPIELREGSPVAAPKAAIGERWAKSQTGVHNAIVRNDVNALREALGDASALMESRNEAGQTPLMLAVSAASTSVDLVQLLLASGADPNAVDKHGLTPLLHAVVAKRSRPVINALLSAGSNINAVHPATGMTALHVALVTDNADATMELISNSANVNAITKASDTSMVLALRHRAHVDVVTALIGAGATLDSASAGAWPVLALAIAYNCRHTVIQALIDAKAPVNVVFDDPGTRSTPLTYAVQQKQLPIVRVLLRAGADVNHVRADMFTPLLMAIDLRQYELVKLLLATGADVNHMTDDADQLTPLTLSLLRAEPLDFGMVSLLLEKNASVTATNAAAQTPLHVAAIARGAPPAAIVALLHAGADVNALDDAGFSALLTALYCADAASDGALVADKAAKLCEAGADGQYELFRALADRHWPAVELLVKHLKVDVRQRSASGLTPLALAAQLGRTQTVQMLIEAGARVDDVRGDEPTVMMEAAAHGHVDLLRYLVKNHPKLIKLRSNKGRTPLMAAMAFTKDEKLLASIVKVLVDAGDDINGYDNAGTTVLMHALHQGRDERVVKLLLSAGADVNRVRPNDGFTPLMVVAKRGKVVPGRALLAAGADAGYTSPVGLTPLLIAVMRDQLEFVQMLLTTAGATKLNVSAYRPDDGMTALMHAVRRNDVALVRELVPHVDVNFVNPRTGDTALLMACAAGADDVAKLLLSKCDVALRNPLNGENALLAAVRGGSEPIINAVLDKGAGVNVFRNDGTNALIDAAAGGLLPVVQALLAAGADPNLLLPETRASPLLAAVLGGHGEVARTLLSANADGNYVSAATGMTPLHAAVRAARPDLVNLLLAARVRPDQPDSRGATPLWLAVQVGNVNIVQRLLQAGSRTDSRADGGMSLLGNAALHDHPLVFDFLLRSGRVRFHSADLEAVMCFAAEHDDTELMRLMAAMGAELDVPSTQGRTPYQLAVSDPQYRASQRVLLMNGAFPFTSRRGGTVSRTHTGFSPMHQMMRPGVPADVRLLDDRRFLRHLESTHDPLGRTPLYIACRHGLVDWVRLLLTNHVQEANINHRDRHGWTPLHEAADAGKADVVALLLTGSNWGVPLNATTDKGETALQLALRRAALLRALSSFKEYQPLAPRYNQLRSGYDGVVQVLRDARAAPSASAAGDSHRFTQYTALASFALLYSLTLPLVLLSGSLRRSALFSEVLLRAHTDVFAVSPRRIPNAVFTLVMALLLAAAVLLPALPSLSLLSLPTAVLRGYSAGFVALLAVAMLGAAMRANDEPRFYHRRTKSIPTWLRVLWRPGHRLRTLHHTVMAGVVGYEAVTLIALSMATSADWHDVLPVRTIALNAALLGTDVVSFETRWLVLALVAGVWSAFAGGIATIIFILALPPDRRQLRRKSGVPAPLPLRRFFRFIGNDWFAKRSTVAQFAVPILTTALWVPVVFTLLQPFAGCASGGMLAAPGIACYSTQHTGMMAVSALLLLMYLPSSLYLPLFYQGHPEGPIIQYLGVWHTLCVLAKLACVLAAVFLPTDVYLVASICLLAYGSMAFMYLVWLPMRNIRTWNYYNAMLLLFAATAPLFGLLAGLFGSDTLVPPVMLLLVWAGVAALAASIVWKRHLSWFMHTTDEHLRKREAEVLMRGLVHRRRRMLADAAKSV